MLSWIPNWWKDFIAKALALPTGSPGAWTLCGDKADPSLQLLADHLCCLNIATG